MGKLEKMREEYDNISIPKELGVRIQQEIDRSQKKQEGKNRASHINRFRKQFISWKPRLRQQESFSYLH